MTEEVIDTQFKFQYLEIQLQKVEIIGIRTVCAPNSSLIIQLQPKSSLEIQLQEDLYFLLQRLRERYCQLDPKNCCQWLLLKVHTLNLILELINQDNVATYR